MALGQNAIRAHSSDRVDAGLIPAECHSLEVAGWLTR